MYGKQYPGQTADKFMLRLPDGMRDEIKEMSARNRRSMNAEIVLMLEKQIRTLETQKADALA